MSEDQKVNRREFIVGTSSAIVGAAAAPGIVEADQKGKGGAPPPPATFASPAGSTIPFSQQELLATGAVRSFTGPQLGEIAFPLGGIGTGTVSLGGRGEFRDWEIFNRPNKNKSLPFTFVAIWTRRLDGTPGREGGRGAAPAAVPRRRRCTALWSGGAAAICGRHVQGCVPVRRDRFRGRQPSGDCRARSVQPLRATSGGRLGAARGDLPVPRHQPVRGPGRRRARFLDPEPDRVRRPRDARQQRVRRIRAEHDELAA